MPALTLFPTGGDMPNCFHLTPKGGTEPEKLSVVDDKMRAFFSAPADPDKYYLGWFDWLGFGLAVGRSFDDMRKDSAGACEEYSPHLALLSWVEEHYTPSAWSER
jgi:hypothetical protein